MAIKYILYNPNAGDPAAAKAIEDLRASYDTTVLINIRRISSYETFFYGLERDADVILCGGDGTLNHFINDARGLSISHALYYFPTGTGNDFARDLGYGRFARPVFRINEQLKYLPQVTINGESRLFLNNVGFGIDGYCCEEGDRLRAQNAGSPKPKPINYTQIAISGLLFHFQPRSATVTVDGKRYTFKQVWLAPVMNGRYYGGGMMAAPGQDRMNKDGTVSLMLFHDLGKLRALAIFPSIFQGKHVTHKKNVTVLEGREITVTFDRPTPLQIDGETIPNVTSYAVSSRRAASEKGAAV